MNESPPNNDAKPPFYTVRCRGVSLSAWSTTRAVGGELREFLQMEVVKNYCGTDQIWRKTSRFWLDELPALIAVVLKAYLDLRVRVKWSAAEAEAAPSDHGQEADPSVQETDRSSPAGSA